MALFLVVSDGRFSGRCLRLSPAVKTSAGGRSADKAAREKIAPARRSAEGGAAQGSSRADLFRGSALRHRCGCCARSAVLRSLRRQYPHSGTSAGCGGVRRVPRQPRAAFRACGGVHRLCAGGRSAVCLLFRCPAGRRAGGLDRAASPCSTEARKSAVYERKIQGSAKKRGEGTQWRKQGKSSSV